MIFHGKGSVELGRSEQDPLYKLPVRRVIGSLYIEFGTIESVKAVSELFLPVAGEIVDGEYQRYVVEEGSYLRQNFWGADPRLASMVEHLSDHQLKHLRVGGHDPVKVYNAYRAAAMTTGRPTVILARTIKGYGLGEAGEGKNITHQQKKMNEADLRRFRDRFNVPIPDDRIADAPFYRPDEKSAEIAYVKERRQALGGAVPRRLVTAPAIQPAMTGVFDEFLEGTEGRKASTTMVFVKMLAKLLRDKEAAKDATQEVFVKLVRDMAKFDDPKIVLPWIYRVATGSTSPVNK